MKTRIFPLVLMLLVFLLAACATAPVAIMPEAPEPDQPVTIEISDVLISGGTYQMGDIWGGENPHGTPVHTVTVSDFYLGTHEVDQALFETVMGSNPSTVKGRDLPVGSVTWFEAVEFCNRVSGILGLEKVYSINGSTVTQDLSKNGYRLPTEGEWEYTARSGGRNDRQWSGTNNENKIEDYAWYYWDDPAPHPVGTKKPNELGLYDMTGNLEEWCWDWYGLYSAKTQTNPTGPADGKNRLGRGAPWNWDADYSRTVRRDGFPPDQRDVIMGFRVARNGE